MVEAILSIIATALGLYAERMRRKWKAAEEYNAKLEQILIDRDRAWDRGDPGGVFNARS